MCQECIDVVNELFPDEPDDIREDILWNFTSYPFGGPEKVREQLLHLKDVGPVVVTKEFNEQYAAAMARNREGENCVRPD